MTRHPRSSARSMSHWCSASSGSVVSLLSITPALAHTGISSISTEVIDASHFKAPLTTSKSQETTSEDAWALFISRCRYANNEYSLKCAQNYGEFEAKWIYTVLPYCVTVCVKKKLPINGPFHGEPVPVCLPFNVRSTPVQLPFKSRALSRSFRFQTRVLIRIPVR